MRLLAGLLLLAVPAWGASLLPSPAPGSSIVVGSTVTVPLVEVPDADEMELVLSLDGGASFPVRVTAEIAPGTRSVSWRVPNLPSPRARLALRAGVDGSESLRAIGDGFTIEPNFGARPEDTTRQGGEWKTREARQGTRSDLPPLGMGSGQTTVDLLLLEAVVEDSPAPFRTSAPPRSGDLAPLGMRHFSRTSASLVLDCPRDCPRRE